jgi:hypothetical protein
VNLRASPFICEKKYFAAAAPASERATNRPQATTTRHDSPRKARKREINALADPSCAPPGAPGVHPPGPCPARRPIGRNCRCPRGSPAPPLCRPERIPPADPIAESERMLRPDAERRDRRHPAHPRCTETVPPTASRCAPGIDASVAASGPRASFATPASAARNAICIAARCSVGLTIAPANMRRRKSSRPAVSASPNSASSAASSIAGL